MKTVEMKQNSKNEGKFAEKASSAQHRSLTRSKKLNASSDTNKRTSQSPSVKNFQTNNSSQRAQNPKNNGSNLSQGSG